MAKGNTLEELHRFFEDQPDDYQLEIQAEARLKALYNCLVNANSRTTLQIGLTGLFLYVKASQRSSIIDELLLSKDYISEIITLAADHFLAAPLLSTTCLYECMLNYPKKFSPFLINKFRPLLPRIIYKKLSGPNELCCKCLAHLSVLGIPSTTKQAKAWKTEYDRYLKVASLLIDQLYTGIGNLLCSDVNDFETALATETGDLVSSRDYAGIFANCCHVLRSLLHVQLDSPVTVPMERTLKLIFKVISINAQQFNLLHRKQNLSILFESCLQLSEAIITFNPSSLTFNLRPMLTSIVSLLHIVHPHPDYSKLTSRIYEILTSFFAIYNRQVRLDLEILQKLNRLIIHDTMIRPRSKVSMGQNPKADPHLTKIVLTCLQQLLNIYSDHMPRDQYILLQNHCLQTLMDCQLTNTIINKPYDNELCRVGLYETFECLLINERADCPTIFAIGKSLIDRAMSVDSSIKVKMIARKLQLIWQQIHDSSSHLYQAWSFLNVEKPRHNLVNSNMTQNELHHVFLPPPSSTISTASTTVTISTLTSTNINNSSSIITINNDVIQPSALTKPTLYESVAAVPSSLPTVSYTNLDLVQTPQTTLPESFVPVTRNNESFEQTEEQQRKRTKVVDTRVTRITDDDDDDGAEQIFADNEQGDEAEEIDDEMMDEDDDEIDESDEVDDDDQMDDDNGSDITSSDDDNQQRIRSNGLTKLPHHLGLHETNVDLLDINRATNETFSNAIEEENLHKKFRRQKPDFLNSKSKNDEISTEINRQNNILQMNGDHRTNGQTTSKMTNKLDDDDIVLVSDDDDDEEENDHVDDDDDDDDEEDDESKEIEEEDQNFEQQEDQSIRSGNDLDSSFSKAQPNEIYQETEHSFVPAAKTFQMSPYDQSTNSVPSEIQETLETLRDAIALLSDDFNPDN